MYISDKWSPITIVDPLQPRTKVRGFKFGDNKKANILKHTLTS